LHQKPIDGMLVIVARKAPFGFSEHAMAKSPGDFISEELAARDWTQTDLAIILKKPLPTVNRILLGKHAILPEMAIALGEAFGNGADIWTQREATYRLSLAEPAADDEVRRRARLFNLAPIKEMMRRGWISSTDETEKLEKELCSFFGVTSLDNDPSIGAVTRRSTGDEPLTPSQRAWCYRVRQLASAQAVPQYNSERIEECKRALRKVAAFPQETHKVPAILASFGIRFVIVEPLTGTKVDGVALWIDDSPAIGLSCRLDRFDSFWFTLGHELTHVENHDEAPLDSELSAETAADDIESLQSVKPAMERKADAGAAAMLIPPAEINSFIKRVGPLYSKIKIVQFANRIKIHPAIVVGQLQHRGEIGYHANREMLAKVKNYILPTAITDGWGNTIDPRSLA
jgi:HTH-type transcriptional regulator/antitoxin HigA